MDNNKLKELGENVEALGCGLVALGIFALLSLAIIGMFISAILRGGG